MQEVERLALKALVGMLRVVIDQIDSYLDSIAPKAEQPTGDSSTNQ